MSRKPARGIASKDKQSHQKIRGSSPQPSLPPETTEGGHAYSPHVQQGDVTQTLASESASASVRADTPHAAERPVIAVSASKGPAAFFNLARKFLATAEMCDLSALEGAIVSAVDAAHLLERSKLATITRIQTSYVSVEPKRKKQGTLLTSLEALAYSSVGAPAPITEASTATTQVQSSAVPTGPSIDSGYLLEPNRSQRMDPGACLRPSGGREMRRARIIITVRRTPEYAKWLEENPHRAAVVGEEDEDLTGSLDDPDSYAAKVKIGKKTSG